jgi:cytochrome P450
MATIDDLDVYDSTQYAAAVPHEKFAELRRTDPVHWAELPDGEGAWYLLKHADVARASREWQQYSAARGGIVLENQTPEALERGRTQLLSMDPPEHTEMRHLVFSAFTPRTVDAMEPWLREQSKAIMQRALEAGETEFVYGIAGELPMQVINQMMAVPDEHRSHIVQLADAVIAGGGGRERGTAEDPGVVLGGLGYQLAAERKGKGGSDLISLMLQATYQGQPLDEVGFAGLFVQIAVAANETTRSLLSGGMLALIEHPEAFATLATEPARIPRAVEEMLRWVTPVHYFRRTATCDIELGGKTIREGDRVALHYTSANHDEDVFADPFRFDIDRDPNPHLAFGWGEHFCLGARLARLETKIFFEELLAAFKTVELTGPVVRLASNLTNTTTHMPVRVTPR